MKKILLVLSFLSLTILTYSQNYTNVSGRWQYMFLKVDSGLRVPSDTLPSALIGSIAVIGSTAYIKTNTFWIAITGAGGSGVWGFITGNINAQNDLVLKFAGKYDTSARKMDTIYAITDSTLGYYINGQFRSFKIRGAVQKFNNRIGAIVLNSADIDTALGYIPSNLPNVANILQVINAGGAISLQTGIYASRPAFGTAGRFYAATDSSKLYLDNSTSWLTISGGGAGGSGTVTSVNTGYGLTGGPVVNSGTILVDSGTLSLYYVRRVDSNRTFATPFQLSLKQNQLNGSGFVKISGTTISYDPTVYEPQIVGSYTIKQYWNGFKLFVPFNSDSIPQGSTNKWFISADTLNISARLDSIGVALSNKQPTGAYYKAADTISTLTTLARLKQKLDSLNLVVLHKSDTGLTAIVSTIYNLYKVADSIAGLSYQLKRRQLGTRGDSINLFVDSVTLGFRRIVDSLDFFTVDYTDSSIVFGVQAHDTTSSHRLASGYDQDTTRNGVATRMALKKNVNDSAATSTSGFVTQASRQKLSDSLQALLALKVANNGASTGIKAGILSVRPSASNCQCFYFSTTDSSWSYDNGSWIPVKGGSGGGGSLPTITNYSYRGKLGASDTILQYSEYNVQDFGIDTGTVDQTAAFNAFFAWVPNGASVHIPFGRYAVNGELFINKRLNIRGDGRGPEPYFTLSTPIPSVGATTITTTSSNGIVFYFNGMAADSAIKSSLHDITIKNNSGSTPTSGSIGVQLGEVSNFDIHDITIYGFYLGINLVSAISTRIYFSTIAGFVQDGIDINNIANPDYGGTQIFYTTILSGNAATTTARGIYIGSGGGDYFDHVFFNGQNPNSTTTNLIYPLYFDFANGPSSEVHVDDCTFNNYQTTGIYARNRSGGLVYLLRCNNNHFAPLPFGSTSGPAIDINGWFDIQLTGNMGHASSLTFPFIKLDSASHIALGSVVADGWNKPYTVTANVTDFHAYNYIPHSDTLTFQGISPADNVLMTDANVSGLAALQITSSVVNTNPLLWLLPNGNAGAPPAIDIYASGNQALTPYLSIGGASSRWNISALNVGTPQSYGLGIYTKTFTNQFVEDTLGNVSMSGNETVAGSVTGSSVISTLGALALYKDATPTKAFNIGYVLPGGGSNGNDLIFGNYAGSWIQRGAWFSSGNFSIGATKDSSGLIQVGPSTSSVSAMWFQPSAVDPVAPKNGALWYDSVSHTFNFRDNNATVNLLASSGGSVPALTSTHIGVGDGSNLLNSSANLTFGSSNLYVNHGATTSAAIISDGSGGHGFMTELSGTDMGIANFVATSTGQYFSNAVNKDLIFRADAANNIWFGDLTHPKASLGFGSYGIKAFNIPVVTTAAYSMVVVNDSSLAKIPYANFNLASFDTSNVVIGYGGGVPVATNYYTGSNAGDFFFKPNTGSRFLLGGAGNVKWSLAFNGTTIYIQNLVGSSGSPNFITQNSDSSTRRTVLIGGTFSGDTLYLPSGAIDTADIQGYGINISRSGTVRTISADSNAMATKAYRQKGIDSLVALINAIPTYTNPKLFAMTADGTVSNTITPTSLIGTGVGSQTIAANVLSAGSVIKFSGGGNITTTLTAPGLAFNLSIAGVNNTINPTIGTSLNSQYEFEATAIVRTAGSSGSIEVTGSVTIAGVKTYFANSSPQFINTTSTCLVDLVLTMSGTVGSGDAVTTKNATLTLQ